MAFFRSMIIRGGALALVLAPSLAFAAVGHTTAHLNLRQGPGTQHRVLTVIPAGAPVHIHSCGQKWCHVSWGWHTGFASGHYLITHVSVPVSPLTRHW